jgi:hypothetical protein
MKRLNVPQEFWMRYDNLWNLVPLISLVPLEVRDSQQDLSWRLLRIHVRAGDSLEKEEVVNAPPSRCGAISIDFLGHF